MTARRVLVLRHAKSDWSEPGLHDIDRPLSGRGRRAAAAMGVYMRDEGLAPDLVLCSAARRAVETWSTVARVGEMAPRVMEEPALYMAGADALFERVRAVDDAVTSVLLVGHAPGFDGFACRLSGDRKSADGRRMTEKFPTGALAVLELDVPSWRDLAEGIARLERFIVPKDLL